MAIGLAWQQGFGRQRIETLLLRVPLVGNMIRLNLTIRFCRTLGMLLENGVELPAAMKLVRDVIGNRSAALALDQAYDALRKGTQLPRAAVAIRPVSAGRDQHAARGRGDRQPDVVLLSHGRMFEEKLETTVQRTFTILEPVIILLVSVFIAGIIISILGAVISMNDLAI